MKLETCPSVLVVFRFNYRLQHLPSEWKCFPYRTKVRPFISLGVRRVTTRVLPCLHGKLLTWLDRELYRIQHSYPMSTEWGLPFSYFLYPYGHVRSLGHGAMFATFYHCHIYDNACRVRWPSLCVMSHRVVVVLDVAATFPWQPSFKFKDVVRFWSRPLSGGAHSSSDIPISCRPFFYCHLSLGRHVRVLLSIYLHDWLTHIHLR